MSSESGTARWTATSGSEEEKDELLHQGLIDTADVVNPMRRLLGFAWESFRCRLFVALTASILNKVLDLMPPLLIAWMIDTVTGNPPGWLVDVSGEPGDTHPRPNTWYLPLALAVLTIVIFFFESLFQFVYQWQFKTIAQLAQNETRMRGYGQLQTLEMAYFENARAGDLLSVLGEDVNRIELFLNTGLNDIVQLVVLAVFCGVVMLMTSWKLTLIGITPMPVVILGSLWFKNTIRPLYARVRGAMGLLSARLENNLGGITVIKAYTQEESEYQRVYTLSEDYAMANVAAIKVSAAFVPIIRMPIALAFAAVVAVGSFAVINDSDEFDNLSAGDLVLFATMVQRVLWPLTRLGDIIDLFSKARASARRVFALLDTEATIQNPDKPVVVATGAEAKKLAKKNRKDRKKKKKGKGKKGEPMVVKGKIEYDGVSFAYLADQPVLKSIDVEIRAGQTVGLVGATGAGKSSFAKLLLRMYDVTDGCVRLDGVDIRSMRLEDLRASVAVVSQQTYLFWGTIYENLAYALPPEEVKRSPKRVRERIRWAAEQARMLDFIEGLPDGFDTVVGERGIRLSGGQRARLSLARAILKDAPIMVLDEATASVDTKTERDIQESLRDIVAGKTALVIAHRLSTIRHADNILVLDHGKIVESGTHDELVDQGGAYSHLWNIQIGELGDNESSSSSSSSSS